MPYQYIPLDVGTRPASRAEAYSLLMRLKTGGASLTPTELDRMILYYAPGIPARAPTAEQWVAKACSTNRDDPRDYLRTMRVKDGIAAATDGHRMHRAATKLPDGHYDPTTMLPVEVDSDTKYPDVSRIVPDRAKCECIEYRDCTEQLGTPDEITRGRKPTRYLVLPGGGPGIAQADYVRQAVNHDKGASLWFVRTDVGDWGVWVVMGVRLP